MAAPLHAPTSRRPAPRARPPLRVLPGGREAALRHRQPAAVYRRRRLGVALAAATVLVAIMALAGRIEAAVVDAENGSPEVAAGTEPAAPLAEPVPLADDVYVVQPGDTLWSIAAQLRPDADPRPLVDQLARAAGGPVLQPGQRIPLDSFDG